MSCPNAPGCSCCWAAYLLLSLVTVSTSLSTSFKALLMYPSSNCCWCCLTTHQQRIHSTSRHRYFLPPCRRKQRHDCSRVCNQDNIVAIVAIEDVIKKFCAPNSTLLDRFPAVRTPEKIHLGESRLNAARRVVLSYSRPAASLVAGVDPKALAQFFLDHWPPVS